MKQTLLLIDFCLKQIEPKKRKEKKRKKEKKKVYNIYSVFFQKNAPHFCLIC